MTKREKIYIWKRKANKRFNSEEFAFQRIALQNLWEFGIAGAHVYLDEQGGIRVKPLTIAECLEFESNPNEDMVIERVKI